ncbi:MAG: tRNA lysidine(34) synthetase TilS [Micavibrio aeruginosavorus]|uniref:tRNA(Ile)-lysidine synthase n=1 Tax=Micavibrio aeruginosavorus TaxID=349221 RepID=A0A2W5Q8I1_9BACT|nr:MAG: tRNA lysidine(34) synthetase TilS [Micavibrio aeruginosavorus]
MSDLSETIALFDKSFDAVLRGDRPRSIAVAVSGGPDSMALLWMLSHRGQTDGFSILAYTVDHGLRAESAEEAAQVGEWVKSWHRVDHHILRWEGEKPDSRILEAARAARYGLMTDDMKRRDIAHLFVAHQQDDQAETFLIRLTKGSGLDGLAGMRPVSELNGVRLLRPLLDIPKSELLLLCQRNNIPYVNDPTNENTDYMRPRLRATQEVLEQEGLSAKRLATTARRLARAKAALEDLSHELFVRACVEEQEEGFLFDYRLLKGAQEELVLRVMQTAMDVLRPDADYAPRMERQEQLLERILRDGVFKSATLGGCLFALDRKNETLWIGKE